ncbi:hypothetical protein AB3N61_13285 [Leptospira sp. WS58.C1]|uniref:hypothetical protein n=1 Tax=Leptospira cinconiae TaxID=3235173 RepID=UPI00349ED1F3
MKTSLFILLTRFSLILYISFHIFFCSFGVIKNEINELPRLVFNFRHASDVLFINDDILFFSCEERYSDGLFRTFVYKISWGEGWNKLREIRGCLIQAAVKQQDDNIVYLLTEKISENRILSKVGIADFHFDFKKEIYATSVSQITRFFLGNNHLIAISEETLDAFRKERLWIGSTEKKGGKILIGEGLGLHFQNNLIIIDNNLVLSKGSELFVNKGFNIYNPKKISFSEGIFNISNVDQKIFITFLNTSDYIEVLERFKLRYRILSSNKDWKFADSIFYAENNKMIALFIAKENDNSGISYRIGVSCDNGKNWTLQKFPEESLRVHNFYIANDFIYLVNYRNLIKISLKDLKCNWQ